jgi:hypothetical protein
MSLFGLERGVLRLEPRDRVQGDRNAALARPDLQTGLCWTRAGDGPRYRRYLRCAPFPDPVSERDGWIAATLPFLSFQKVSRVCLALISARRRSRI